MLQCCIVLALEVLRDGDHLAGWLLGVWVFPFHTFLVSVVDIELEDLPLFAWERIACVLSNDRHILEISLNFPMDGAWFLRTIVLEWSHIVSNRIDITELFPFGDDCGDERCRLPETGVGDIQVDDELLAFCKTHGLIDSTPDFDAASKISTLALTLEDGSADVDELGIAGRCFAQEVIHEVDGLGDSDVHLDSTVEILLHNGNVHLASLLDVQSKAVAIATRGSILLHIKVNHDPKFSMITERPSKTIAIVDDWWTGSILSGLGSPDFALHSTLLCTGANDDVVLIDLDVWILSDRICVDIDSHWLASSVVAGTSRELGGQRILLRVRAWSGNIPKVGMVRWVGVRGRGEGIRNGIGSGLERGRRYLA